MKKLNLLSLALSCALGFASCSDSTNPVLAEEQLSNVNTAASTGKIAAAPWVKHFEDTFNVGSNLSQWTIERRADYHSWYCE